MTTDPPGKKIVTLRTNVGRGTHTDEPLLVSDCDEFRKVLTQRGVKRGILYTCSYNDVSHSLGDWIAVRDLTAQHFEWLTENVRGEPRSFMPEPDRKIPVTQVK